MEPVGGATAAGKGTLAAFRIGDTTKRNSRLAERVYEDLVRWARHDIQAEARALDAKHEELNKRNLFYSGHANSEDARIRGEFAQRWRDRRTAAEREIEDLHDSESVVHRMWRKIVRRPWPENPHREEIELLTAAGEERVS